MHLMTHVKFTSVVHWNSIKPFLWVQQQLWIDPFIFIYNTWTIHFSTFRTEPKFPVFLIRSCTILPFFLNRYLTFYCFLIDYTGDVTFVENTSSSQIIHSNENIKYLYTYCINLQENISFMKKTNQHKQQQQNS